jgi:hypothetical protein
MEIPNDAFETPGSSPGHHGANGNRNLDSLGAMIEAEAARYDILSAGGEGPPRYEDVA